MVLHLRQPGHLAAACGESVADRRVRWANTENFAALLDGEIRGIEACPPCLAAYVEQTGQLIPQADTPAAGV